MNKKGFIDLEFLSEIHPVAWILGIIGIPIGWWYVGYLDVGFGIVAKSLVALGTFVLGTFVSHWIFSR